MQKPRKQSPARKKRRALVLGGGISGLGVAILLARRGWSVRVLERDHRPPVATPEDAFRFWRRPGLPQFRHSHTFLARLTAVLREHFPEVLTALRAAGTIEIPLTIGTPPSLDLGPREKGDGELVLLGARRAAFEWALLEVARSRPEIEITEGVYCEDLLHEPGPRGQPPQIVGARIRSLPALSTAGDDGQIPWKSGGTPRAQGRARQIRADLVIDATGRRSNADRWLSAIGVDAPEEERIPTGIYYFTRFYRLTGSRPPGGSTGLVAGDVGWLKLATFPGDGDTFSITVGANIDDRPFRALSDPKVFEALITSFPQIAVWRAHGVSQPIDGADTPVLVMGGLENLKRRFDKDGVPLVRGFVAVGDSLYHSNPIYGRGVTSGMLAVTLLDQALNAHPGEIDAAIATYHARARVEVEPFWRHAAASDRMSQAMRENRNREDDPSDLWSWAWSWVSDPTARVTELSSRAAKTFLEQGFGPALREDGQVYRAAMRVMNMLDMPQDGLLSANVLSRAVPYLVRSLVWPPHEQAFPGPTRTEALALIEKMENEGEKPARPRKTQPRSKSTRLRPDSEVAGHA
ncbi:MAG: FAD-dependent oxidoreductase [Candidatus Binatia bacterium]|nr:FAD-dependent oxidoreductase [Candidatus Binatia bacterium]